MKNFIPFLLVLAVILAVLFAPLLIHHGAKLISTGFSLVKSTIRAFVADVRLNFNSVTPKIRHKQFGFVTLLRPYGGYQAGQVVELPASTEAAIVASGGGTTNAGPASVAPITCQQNQGAVGIAAGQISAVITNPLITPQSIVIAYVSQTTADGTLLRIDRVVPAAGSVTIFGNAAATATVNVDWAIVGSIGGLTNPA